MWEYLMKKELIFVLMLEKRIRIQENLIQDVDEFTIPPIDNLNADYMQV
jgi:hypothetical protein